MMDERPDCVEEYNRCDSKSGSSKSGLWKTAAYMQPLNKENRINQLFDAQQISQTYFWVQGKLDLSVMIRLECPSMDGCAYQHRRLLVVPLRCEYNAATGYPCRTAINYQWPANASLAYSFISEETSLPQGLGVPEPWKSHSESLALEGDMGRIPP